MPRVKRSSRLDLEVSSENDWRIKSMINKFILNHQQISELREKLKEDMEKGLSDDAEHRRESSLQMAVTFVRGVLNGSELGNFLALDLGGTNFRILDVSLRSGSKCLSSCENFAIPAERLRGTAAEMFEFIADKLAEFIHKEELDKSNKRIPLGFTYSYPLGLTSLTSGVIERLNKSLKISDAIGKDPVKLLQEAINKHSLNIDVLAILNDTTGTLMSGAFIDAACGIGLIMGTGSNVCYMERICNIPKWQSLTGQSPDECQEFDYVIVNTEWGAFGDNGVINFLKTEFDFQLDKESLHAGTYTFEKLFSGMYLGELARVTLVKLCEEGLVFGGKPSEALLTPGGFPSSFISRVEQDNHRDLSNTYRCLKELKLSSVSDEDYHVVRFLANALSVRAAQIVAAGLSVIVERMQRSEVAIAVDGSLYKKHPKLQFLIQEFLDMYCEEVFTHLVLAEDGSGKGAAFTAAVAERIKYKSDETDYSAVGDSSVE